MLFACCDLQTYVMALTPWLTFDLIMLVRGLHLCMLLSFGILNGAFIINDMVACTHILAWDFIC